MRKLPTAPCSTSSSPGARIGTPAARKALRALAENGADSELAREARAALDRTARR